MKNGFLSEEDGMVSRRGFLGQMAGLIMAGGLPRGPAARGGTPMTVYKSRTCGCCTKWVEHVKAHGFDPRVQDEEAMDQLKTELGVPEPLRSCHTAMVGGYLIEGHVPAADIRRLLALRPKAAGAAVPGMPGASPGMAAPGAPIMGFDVLLFQPSGATEVFARY
jgi:hypothetical protein